MASCTRTASQRPVCARLHLTLARRPAERALLQTGKVGSEECMLPGTQPGSGDMKAQSPRGFFNRGLLLQLQVSCTTTHKPAARSPCHLLQHTLTCQAITSVHPALPPQAQNVPTYVLVAVLQVAKAHTRQSLTWRLPMSQYSLSIHVSSRALCAG